MNKKIRVFKLQPLAEVGFYCGFSEQASFSRAFKRWTGKTASAYRAILLDDAV